MGLFTRYAMDAPDEDLPPPRSSAVSAGISTPTRTPCTACKDICPYGDAIFTRPQRSLKTGTPAPTAASACPPCRSGLHRPFAGAGTAGHLAGGYR